MHCSKIAALRGSLLCTGFPNHKRLANPNIHYYWDFTLKSHGVRRDGSAALDLAYVAAGRFEGFWEFGLKPWDTAAGVILVEEAGGKISSRNSRCQRDHKGHSGRIGSGARSDGPGHERSRRRQQNVRTGKRFATEHIRRSEALIRAHRRDISISRRTSQSYEKSGPGDADYIEHYAGDFGRRAPDGSNAAGNGGPFGAAQRRNIAVQSRVGDC